MLVLMLALRKVPAIPLLSSFLSIVSAHYHRNSVLLRSSLAIWL